MYKPTPKEDLEKEAKELGLIAIFPYSNEIMLDFDEGMKLNTATFDLIGSMGITLLGALETTSKSGNTHYYIAIDKPMSTIEQVAIAACLGSDPVREMLASLYYLTHEMFTMCLYEKPEEYAKVEEWRTAIQKVRVVEDPFA